MTWMPILKPGIINAWILCLFMLIHPFVMAMVDRLVGSGDIYRKMGGSAEEAGGKQSIPIPTVLLVALFILSIFLPLREGTIWLYAGLAIYLFGVSIFLSAMITAAKTPAGRVFTKGMYLYSRHPLYLAFIFVFVGISLASASWLFLLLSVGWMAIPISQVKAEEQGCLESFGIEYLQYKKRTSKWLGFPKSN